MYAHYYTMSMPCHLALIDIENVTSLKKKLNSCYTYSYFYGYVPQKKKNGTLIMLLSKNKLWSDKNAI